MSESLILGPSLGAFSFLGVRLVQLQCYVFLLYAIIFYFLAFLIIF